MFPVATKVPKLGEYLPYWLQEIVAPNLAPLTYATYETLTRLYIVPGLGSKRLDKLTVRDIQTWLNKVRQSCQCCVQGKDACRPEKTRRYCAVGKCCGSVASLRTVGAVLGHSGGTDHQERSDHDPTANTAPTQEKAVVER